MWVCPLCNLMVWKRIPQRADERESQFSNASLNASPHFSQEISADLPGKER